AVPWSTGFIFFPPSSCSVSYLLVQRISVPVRGAAATRPNRRHEQSPQPKKAVVCQRSVQPFFLSDILTSFITLIILHFPSSFSCPVRPLFPHNSDSPIRI
ncbi:uncharacterized protein BO96DRAFT_465158, partial [Aspergillus niger CBS 101883]|uniref:uncharacterized protein n=1 Tax=Aspergillus lacticoffeatus (strain CBS 101883) TaxID=1450533 RepID=UPI000D7FC01A